VNWRIKVDKSIFIQETLTPIFKDVFDNLQLNIDENTTSDDVDGWDSVSNIKLLIMIEKKLKITFDLSKVSSLENVGQMAELILGMVQKE